MSSSADQKHPERRGTTHGLVPRISAWILIAEIVIVLAAPLTAPHDPYQHHPQQRFSPPSRTFPLGTDHLGRDILSRVIFGGREMLFTLLLALGISMLLGGGAGMLSATLPLRFDGIITLAIDVALSVPAVLLAIILIGAFGASLVALALTLAAVFAPVTARQVRGLTQEALTHPSIEIVRIAGGSTAYILLRHILPAIRTQIIQFTTLIAVLMISISSALSFLGLARRPPLADWGLMLRDARSYLLSTPWIAISPGAAILLTGLLLHYAGASIPSRTMHNLQKQISKNQK